jgi:hypothetical protein
LPSRVLTPLAGLLLVASALQGQEPLSGPEPVTAPAIPPARTWIVLPAAAEADSVGVAPAPPAVRLIRPDGVHGDAARLAELTGVAPRGLLRAPSTLMQRLGRGHDLRAAILLPETMVLWNSAIPVSLNEGALWGGRGLNLRMVAGLVIEAGPLRVIAAPELVRWENRAFEESIPAHWRSSDPPAYQPEWQQQIHSIDMPYRFGDAPETRLTAGQSSVALHAGPVVVGAATESHWWGPGVRNAIVLSTNAPGFPHLFLRTADPLPTPIGALEARWMVGRLTGSGYPLPEDPQADDHRSFAALGVTLAPRGARGLTVGAARGVYAPLSGTGLVPGRFTDAVRRWDAGRPGAQTEAGQVLSLFGRLLLPSEGAELYAEWARHEMPRSLRDLLESPEHSQGFTVGAGWARPAGAGTVWLRAEATHLERGSTFRARPMGSFYASERVPAGYSHRGRVLGAAIGPGSQAQWTSVDWNRRGSGIGIFGGRTRLANDAYYDQPAGHRRYRGHDVTLYGGARARTAAAGYGLNAEWTVGKRFNYLFQNWSTGWGDRENAVNVVNHSLRVSITPGIPLRR